MRAHLNGHAHGVQLYPVKLGGVLFDRLITPRTHILHNRRHLHTITMSS